MEEEEEDKEDRSALPRTKPCCLHSALTTTYTHPTTTSTSVVRPYPSTGPALPRCPQGTIPSCLADDDTARGCVLHVVAFCQIDRSKKGALRTRVHARPAQGCAGTAGGVQPGKVARMCTL